MCKAPPFPLPDAQDSSPNYATHLLILISFLFQFIPLIAHHLNRSNSPVPKPQSTQPLPDKQAQNLQTIQVLTTAFDDLLRERNMLWQSVPDAQRSAAAPENRELNTGADTESNGDEEDEHVEQELNDEIDANFPWPLGNSSLLSGPFELGPNPFPWRSWVEDDVEEEKNAMRRAGPPGMEWMVMLDPD